MASSSIRRLKLGPASIHMSKHKFIGKPYMCTRYSDVTTVVSLVCIANRERLIYFYYCLYSQYSSLASKSIKDEPSTKENKDHNSKVAQVISFSHNDHSEINHSSGRRFSNSTGVEHFLLIAEEKVRPTCFYYYIYCANFSVASLLYLLRCQEYHRKVHHVDQLMQRPKYMLSHTCMTISQY